MFDRNKDVKNASNGIPNWAIAEKLGISENTFYRWLRRELPPKKKEEIFKIIEEIKEELR